MFVGIATSQTGPAILPLVLVGVEDDDVVAELLSLLDVWYLGPILEAIVDDQFSVKI